MKLMTNEIDKALSNPDLNYENAKYPICKFFNPVSAGVWLVFARDKQDADLLWCVADMGYDCVEYGIVRLSELQSIKLLGGHLGIEREKYWSPKKKDNGELWSIGDYLQLKTLEGI